MNTDNKIRPEPRVSHGRSFSKGDSLQELVLNPQNTIRRYGEDSNSSHDNPVKRNQDAPLQDLSNLASNYTQVKEQREGISGYNHGGLSNSSSPAPSAHGLGIPYRPSRPSTPEVRLIGPAPPQPQAGELGFPAPRLYHRMVTEYETIRTIFYVARTQPNHNDLSPVAAKLKFLSREIWNLRYSRASEFPYSDSVTEERITEWKVQYDYWNDVLEDLLDPRYVARAQLEKSEDDWAGVAGLASAPGTVPIARKKVTLSDPLDDRSEQEDEEIVPVSILKKEKKSPGNKDTPKKKKVSKRTDD